MTWWDSFETLSKLQTTLAIFVTALGIFTLAIKLRADHLKKQTDARRTIERTQLDDELRDQTTAALKATAALEAFNRPRTISPEQESAFSAALVNAPRGPVGISRYQASDIGPFSAALGDMLRKAGFPVSRISDVTVLGVPPVGLFIGVADINNPPAHAPHIMAALQRIGFNTSRVNDRTATDGIVVIGVGSKP